MIELKYFKFVKSWYMREYGSPKHAPSFPTGWRHEFQKGERLPHTPRSRCSHISNDDVVRLKNSIQENSRKSLRVDNTELGIPF